jgi:hypothetical protein
MREFLRIRTKQMEKRFSKAYPQRWGQVALLLGLCIILYFLNLGRWDFWSPDVDLKLGF